MELLERTGYTKAKLKEEGWVSYRIATPDGRSDWRSLEELPVGAKIRKEPITGRIILTTVSKEDGLTIQAHRIQISSQKRGIWYDGDSEYVAEEE